MSIYLAAETNTTIGNSSYQSSNKDFWSSKQLPIPVLSTVSSHLSGLGFTLDRDTDISSEEFEETEAAEFLEETEVAAEPAEEVFDEIQVTSEEVCGEPKTVDMSGPGPTDPDAATEVIILCALRKKVEYKIRRMDDSRVTDKQQS